MSKETCNLCKDVVCVVRGKGRTIVEVEQPFTTKEGVNSPISIEECEWRQDILRETGVEKQTYNGWTKVFKRSNEEYGSLLSDDYYKRHE